MYKTHSKTLEMALKRLYFSKFPGEHAVGPLEVLAPLAVRFGQIHVRPQKFLSPYAHVSSWQAEWTPTKFAS